MIRINQHGLYRYVPGPGFVLWQRIPSALDFRRPDARMGRRSPERDAPPPAASMGPPAEKVSTNLCV